MCYLRCSYTLKGIDYFGHLDESGDWHGAIRDVMDGVSRPKVEIVFVSLPKNANKQFSKFLL